MRSGILVTGSVAMLLLLSCRKQVNPDGPAAPIVSGPRDPDLRVKAGGYHGNHFTGPVYLPRASPIADGTTAYNVIYQNGVVVVSKEDTQQHLVAIRRDGSYVFDLKSSQIAKLKPGSVVLLSGLALCTVLEVKKTSDGYLLKGTPAQMTDAIREGRLEGTYNVDFSRMLAAPGATDFNVDFAGYNYHVKFTPAKDRIGVQAIIKYGGSQGMLAYEGVGYLSNFVTTIRMQIKDSQVTNLDFSNSGLAGQVELKWFALAADSMKAGSITKITSWPAELLKSSLLSKAAYHVPIVMGTVPFDLRISLGFSFIPEFSSKNSVVEGNELIRYSGSAGSRFLNGQTRPWGSITVSENDAGQDNRVVAAGPVGFTAATEAPRLDLALGWPPTNLGIAGYLNFIASYGTVTNGMASQLPCQTNIVAFSVNTGSTYASPNTFANWLGPESPGASSSVSVWQKTTRSAGAAGRMCPG